MKKILLACTLLATILTTQAAVGDDVTSKYLQNADFSQGTPVEGYICTYDYDMEKNGSVLYGQQNVEGWTNVKPSDNTYVPDRTDGLFACAAGLFTIGAFTDEGDPVASLGGAYYAPDTNTNGLAEGNALAVVAVWSSFVQYTQAVTLPAGAYTIKISTWNDAGTNSVNQNLCGFIADDGTSYVVDKLTWSADWEWVEDEVTFILTEETSGVISLGYVASNGGSGAMPHLFFDYIKIIEADPTAIDIEEANKLKPTLLELLEAGDQMGVSTTAGWAVYNNESATLAEVTAAIENQKEINAANMTDFTDFFINNAHFALGDPLDNGICTYAKDMETNGTPYFGMQPVLDWTPNDPGTDGKAAGLFPVGGGETTWLGAKNQGFVPPTTKANGATEGSIFGFVSCWTFSANYTQQVTLPAGSYTITIPTYNATGGTTAIAKNLCGFIADNGDEYLGESLTFPVNQWSNETIKFTLEEETSGVISIGYEAANVGSASMPHLFIDEFTLMFNGKTDVDPSLIALNGAIRSGEAVLSSGEICESVMEENLEKALDAARELKDANSEDAAVNTAAATEVNNAIVAMKASIATYAKFNEFLEGKYTETIEKYEGGEMGDFADELADDLLGYEDGYSEGSFTTEQINEIVNGFNARVADAIKVALVNASADGNDHNLDITPLFSNVNFAGKSTAGWTSSVTSGKFESQQNGVCEVWSADPVDFTASFTLADLPAGVYEVSAPGWFRASGDAATGYEAYSIGEEVGTSYIFANGNKKKLLSQYIEPLFADAEDGMHNAAVGPGYIPNGQSAAQAIFYTTDIDVNNSVVTALASGGDLTIGFKGDGLSNGTWTVWGAMTIVYKGINEDALALCMDDEINDLIEEAGLLAEDGVIATVQEALDKLCSAIEAGENAQETDVVETKTAAIEALESAISYASQTPSLMDELANLVYVYDNLRYDVEIESLNTELESLLDAAVPENGAESNEQIQEWIDAYPVAWTKFICGQPEMANASEESPVDVTPAILNAGFTGIDGTNPGPEYWDITRNGGSENVEYDIYEFYNANSFDISQQIAGLTPGFYRVRVQSFYRAGSNADNVATFTTNPDSINTVQFYANNDSVTVKNVLELEDIESEGYVAGSQLGVNGEVTVDFNGNPQFYVPNNRESMSVYLPMGVYWNEIDCEVGEDGILKIGLTKAVGLATDWCPFDNFELYYIGTTSPSAIETIAVSESANANPSAIYDLQGRKVSKVSKGLYIVNNKVIYVK